MAASRERLVALLEKPVASAGLDLEDLAASNAGKRRLIRVIVDGDGGVSLDKVAEVSRAISAVLDESNVMGEQPYVLEVTSPGVDRPLTAARHWRRAIGRLVAVRLADGTSVTGRIEAADEDGADLDVDGQLRRIALADVAKAQVQVEFNRGGEEDLESGDDLAEDDDGHDDQDDETEEEA